MTNLQEMTMRFVGLTPLIMHSDTLANPLHPLTKEMKAVSGKRKKTDEDHMEMARIEFLGSLYLDKEMGLILPSRMLKATLLDAAKKSRKGTQVKAGLLLLDSKFKLEHDGPNTADELWADDKYRLVTSVKVQTARIMRTRPIIEKWAVTFKLLFDTTLLDAQEVVDFATTAGNMCGLGDWRISCGGEFGRFSVEVL